VLLDLGGTEPAGVKNRLCEANGTIRRIINIYVNEEGIRFLQGTAPPPEGGDAVSIVHALGSESPQDNKMHHRS